jgi:hypothetical protein
MYADADADVDIEVEVEVEVDILCVMVGVGVIARGRSGVPIVCRWQFAGHTDDPLLQLRAGKMRRAIVG